MVLYVSLSTYGGVTTRESLTAFWQAGIRHVELAIGPKPNADAAAAIEEFWQRGMSYRAHHAIVWEAVHHPFNLTNGFDEAYFVRLTNWLARLQITAYSVHGGSFRKEENRNNAYARFVANIHKLKALCCAQGITLGVETMYSMPPTAPNQYLLDHAQEVAQFCTDVHDVKLVIDLAHLNIWHHNSLEERLSLLKTSAERILEIHISDNDGLRDIHSAITAETWWLPESKYFPKEVPVVLESRMHYSSAQSLQQECDRVLQLLQNSPI